VFSCRYFPGRLLLCGLLAVAGSGCQAQSAAPNVSNGTKAVDPKLDRRIEVLVRSQLTVPPDYAVAIGPRSKSAFTGYDTVPITFSLPSKPAAKPVTVDFLLSEDGTTLARLQKFDLTKDPTAVAQLTNRPIRGAETAKVTIVNFDDLECPYCARMHQELFPQTLDHYKGLIKVVYKDNPLVEIHPWAMRASVDANCLADQSGTAYWAYVDYVHSHGDEISGTDRDVAKASAALDRIAREQGAKENVNAATLEACLKKQDNGAVLASMKEADHLNIEGAPMLFINGERLSGALPIEQVWAVIDRALVAEGVTPPAAPTKANPPKTQSGTQTGTPTGN
jgi:protein-disulfide isomerase